MYGDGDVICVSCMKGECPTCRIIAQAPQDSHLGIQLLTRIKKREILSNMMQNLHPDFLTDALGSVCVSCPMQFASEQEASQKLTGPWADLKHLIRYFAKAFQILLCIEYEENLKVLLSLRFYRLQVESLDMQDRTQRQ